MSLNAIGILPEQRLSYIDHLVPLCQIMQIPLLVTDAWIQALIELYYPPMQLILAQPSDFNLDPFLEGYEAFFYVDYFRKGNGTFQFGDYFTSLKARSVMCLHGQPDKYWDIYWIEQLMDEDIVLSYGPLMQTLLAARGVYKPSLICGNYRLEFYQMHEAFFDQRLPLNKQKQTILYAPTWGASARTTEHREHYSNFFEVYQKAFNTLTPSDQLIVKLHPHLYKTLPEEVEELIEHYPHIHFLKDYPPIYPLLKQIDCYWGDYSSIGYDFLYFDRPLIFLEQARNTHLQRCVDRKSLYQQVFGERKCIKQLKMDIENACRSPLA